MNMINWPLVVYTLVSAIIIAIIPLFVKWFFNAKQAWVAKIQAIYNANKEKINDLVLAAQQLFPSEATKEKYDYVLKNFDNLCKLPEGSIETLVNQAIAVFKQSFGDQWKQIGGTNTTTTATATTAAASAAIPTTTTSTTLPTK